MRKYALLSILFLNGCSSSIPTDIRLGETTIEKQAARELGTTINSMFDINGNNRIESWEVKQKTEEIQTLLERATYLSKLYDKLERYIPQDKD